MRWPLALAAIQAFRGFELEGFVVLVVGSRLQVAGATFSLLLWLYVDMVVTKRPAPVSGLRIWFPRRLRSWPPGARLSAHAAQWARCRWASEESQIAG